jgi:hypothetical protein
LYLVDFVLWPRIPSELVGAWRSQGGEVGEVTLEFQPNGAFMAYTMVNGKKGGTLATAGVEDKLLHIKSTNPRTGKEETKTHVIRSLTESELTLEDPTGVVSKFVRLR